MCIKHACEFAICYLAIKEAEIPEKQLDAIIIGSGIGGLSCAASLAMCNYKMPVLEKNPSLGGSMAGFADPESGKSCLKQSQEVRQSSLPWINLLAGWLMKF
jgi:heterodisulfide reductase subunit A-like polyferredoxin